MGLRSVGDDRAELFVRALGIVFASAAAACVVGVAALVGCTRLGWGFAFPLPVGDAVRYSGQCIAGAGWIAAFSPAVTLLCGRRWCDVPRVAFLPVTVTLVAWFALAARAPFAVGGSS